MTEKIGQGGKGLLLGGAIGLAAGVVAAVAVVGIAGLLFAAGLGTGDPSEGLGAVFFLWVFGSLYGSFIGAGIGLVAGASLGLILGATGLHRSARWITTAITVAVLGVLFAGEFTGPSGFEGEDLVWLVAFLVTLPVCWFAGVVFDRQMTPVAPGAVGPGARPPAGHGAADMVLDSEFA
jgi:hypothetical protein